VKEPEFSEALKRFIADHIHSVAQLEILLLLQTNPGQAWSAADLARELRIETTGASQQLEALVRSGLARADLSNNVYVYAPQSDELHQATVTLAQAYLTRRVTVIGLIFAPNPSLRAFSDAFRLRKDPP
jgi:hypothetical protein